MSTGSTTATNVPPLDWTATPRRLRVVGTLLPRQRGTRTSPAACRHAATVTRASTISRYAVRSLRGEHLGGYLGTLYDLSEHLGRCRVRGLIGPARIEPSVAALQTTLVPRRHQFCIPYVRLRVPQRCAHAHARLSTVSQHLSHLYWRAAPSPHRHRARYGASKKTTCSQSVHRVFTGRRTRRSLSVVLAAATASDSIARGSEEARGGEAEEKARVVRAVRGGESRRAQRFSVRRCGDGVA